MNINFLPKRNLVWLTPVSMWKAVSAISLVAIVVIGLSWNYTNEISAGVHTELSYLLPAQGSVSGVNTSVLPGLLDDGSTKLPPGSGTYAYNSFVPTNTAGATYTDPVFGTTVRRLSTDHNADDSYARNMFWNADGTKYIHRSKNGTAFPDYLNVIDTATGNIVNKGIGIGTIASDAGFDPVDPNVLYTYVGDTIHKITLNSDGSWVDTVYFKAPSTLLGLGGTLNWMDAAGKYMIVRYGNEPSVHLYDRQNLSAGPFANAVDGSATVDTNGYVGISPDGKYVVGYSDVGGYNMGQGMSWKIDAANRSLAASPNIFWSLCGDHGTFISPSDGRDYMVVSNCYDSPDIWLVDITNNAAGPLAVSAQKILPNNKKLLTFPNWNLGVHYSSVAKGTLQDWVFVSTEDSRDTYNSDPSTFWAPYDQEIIGINVITGEIRRLAHHSSRSVTADYYNTPRLTTSWGGEYIGWNSNFDQSGNIDVYEIPFGSSAGVVNTSPPPPSPFDTVAPIISITSPTTGSTVSSTIIVTVSASDDVAVSNVQLKLDGNNLGASMSAAPYTYNWDTTSASNGSHTLSAVATDSSGNIATASGIITVSNIVSTPQTLPKDGKLIQQTNSPTIYVMEYGLKRAFTSKSVFTGFGYKWGNIIQYPDLSWIPDGAVLSTANQRHVRGTVAKDATKTIYFLGADLRYAFTSSKIFKAWGWDFNDVVSMNSWDAQLPNGGVVSDLTQ